MTPSKVVSFWSGPGFATTKLPRSTTRLRRRSHESHDLLNPSRSVKVMILEDSAAGVPAAPDIAENHKRCQNNTLDTKWLCTKRMTWRGQQWSDPGIFLMQEIAMAGYGYFPHPLFQDYSHHAKFSEKTQQSPNIHELLLAWAIWRIAATHKNTMHTTGRQWSSNIWGFKHQIFVGSQPPGKTP